MVLNSKSKRRLALRASLVTAGLSLFVLSSVAWGEPLRRPAQEAPLTGLEGEGFWIPASRFKYGMAGCGLAAVIFENHPSRFRQVVGSWVNGVTFPLQIIGILSGSLKCHTEPPEHFLDTQVKAGGARLYQRHEPVRPEHIPPELWYGSGGCGPGAALLRGGEGFNQVFVSSTNQTSMHTFSISSATSGCEPPGDVRRQFRYARERVLERLQWRRFLSFYRGRFEVDFARGEGEVLSLASRNSSCRKESLVSWYRSLESPEQWQDHLDSLVTAVSACQPTLADQLG
jgi:hypothetical protein